MLSEKKQREGERRRVWFYVMRDSYGGGWWGIKDRKSVRFVGQINALEEDMTPLITFIQNLF